MKKILAFLVSALSACALTCVSCFLFSISSAEAQGGFGVGSNSGRLRQWLEQRRAKKTGRQQSARFGAKFIPPEEQRYISRGSLVHQSMKRTYSLFVPPSVSKQAGKVPLVLVLHGGGGNAEFSMKVSGFNAKAMKEGFIAAYPEGTGPVNGILLTWNAGHCCGSAMRDKVDDVGFISKLIDKLIREYPIDARRVYVTGMSNGGMMTHRLGMELSDKIAAIGPVVATLFGDEKMPANPVAAIIFNGLLDRSVVYKGGTHGGRHADAWDNVPPLNVEAQAVFWARANGCRSRTPTVTDSRAVKHLHYSCPQGRDVDMYIVKDNGHAWPGGRQGGPRGDTPSQSIDATSLMWEFFKRQSR